MKWVYIFISDLTRNEYDYYFSLMDVNKQKQVSRYKNEIDKKRTVAGEMLARRMISKYCNINEIRSGSTRPIPILLLFKVLG